MEGCPREPNREIFRTANTLKFEWRTTPFVFLQVECRRNRLPEAFFSLGRKLTVCVS